MINILKIRIAGDKGVLRWTRSGDGAGGVKVKGSVCRQVA